MAVTYMTYNSACLTVLVMFEHILEFFKAYMSSTRQVSSCIHTACPLLPGMPLLVCYLQGCTCAWLVTSIHTSYLAGNTMQCLPDQT
jgi:hypothetical protein